MPRPGIEPIRRDALVKAAIAAVGHARSADVTVSEIARRAGVSAALAHHYFGAKEQILEAAMRHILTVYGTEVRAALHGVRTPRARLEAVVRGSFARSNFEGGVVAAWLALYARARTVPEAQRLLTIYQRRLRSNLLAGLRPLAGKRAEAFADLLAALIDGLYLRAALASTPADPVRAEALVHITLDHLLEGKE